MARRAAQTTADIRSLRADADVLSDAELVDRVGAMLCRPRVEMADSFVLHAPLELAARAALLPQVAPAARREARQRLVDLAVGYERADDAVPEPPKRDFGSTREAAGRLRDAITAADLDEVDAVASWLGRAAAPGELRALLADDVVPRLSAAAHAPIFLYQLPRVAPRGELTGELLRPLARELARFDWRLTWYEGALTRGSRVDGATLGRAIRSTPRIGVPGNDFIFPIMDQVERTGVAAELLGDIAARVEPHEAAHEIMRAAVASMLAEPDDYAPYGWSHCLTIPQAMLGIADACTDPTTAVAVAATFVLGFRASLATQPLLDTYTPEPTGIGIQDALAAGPDAAAATMWHAAPSEVPGMVTEIVTRAASHYDAHLVKYTLACLDAAAWDPPHGRLYLAAAASLGGFWTQSPDYAYTPAT